MKRENNLSSLFGAESDWGGGGGVGDKSNSRERKPNLSLDFPVFGSSVLVWPRRKVIIHCKGYARASVLWSFDKLREVWVLSYLI